MRKQNDKYTSAACTTTHTHIYIYIYIYIRVRVQANDQAAAAAAATNSKCKWRLAKFAARFGSVLAADVDGHVRGIYGMSWRQDT